MGNSDKMIFYAKEMISDLSMKPKANLDPFIISKLNLESINYFTFPKIPVSLNKYVMRNKGIAGLDYLVETDKRAICGVAKSKVEMNSTTRDVEDLINGNVGDILNLRNLAVPSLL